MSFRRLWGWLAKPDIAVIQGEARLASGRPVLLISNRELYANLTLNAALRKLGYRSVEREYACLATRYVRTLPLWLIHRVGVSLQRTLWATVYRLHHWGFLRIACPEAVIPRLRDLRPSLPLFRK